MDELNMLAVSDDYFVGDTIVVEPAGSPVPLVTFRLRDQKSRIIANWTVRVATLPAFRAMPNIAREDVERRIPDVLESALIAISTSDPTMDPGPLERAIELSAAHGRDRLLDDFGVGDVLSEFNALYLEVWSAFWRVIDTEENPAELLRAFSFRLAETFDAICVAATEAWVEAKLNGMPDR
jgi:hypothetical protein